MVQPMGKFPRGLSERSIELTSFAKSASFQHELCSAGSALTFSDPSQLRGTSPATLLRCGGSCLRSSPGGIGHNQGDHLDMFDNSSEVPELDVFLSHSWSANWLMKYITLLLYFNSIPAVLCASCVGILCFIASHLDEHPWESTAHMIEYIGDSCIGYPSLPFAEVLGSVVFVVILMSWHEISEALYACIGCSAIRVFLDKVCINQIDLVQKEKGIRSIGAFCAKSRTLLVAWDQSYFTRLWCAFEISAYKYARPEGAIVFAPIYLGGYVLAYLTILMLDNLLVYLKRALICYRCLDNYPTFGHIFLFEVDVWGWRAGWFNVFSIWPAVWIVRRFLRDRSALNRQLQEFSVRRSSCFCCANNHIHPDTGETLMCDRKRVYASIAYWHGDGN